MNTKYFLMGLTFILIGFVVALKQYKFFTNKVCDNRDTLGFKMFMGGVLSLLVGLYVVIHELWILINTYKAQ